ncbi:hypothetical protein ACFWAM_49040, partial [Rhodococcus jostii]
EDAEADPYLPKPDLHVHDAGLSTYRTEPWYWLGVVPPIRSVTITASWPQIGLASTPMALTFLDREPASPAHDETRHTQIQGGPAGADGLAPGSGSSGEC